jgi:MraZ protein
MFLGNTTLNLDAKGRIAFPAKYRNTLAENCQSRVVITRNPRDNCLWLYPQDEWHPIARQVAKLPALKTENRTLQRLLLGSAIDMTLDSQGRISIPSDLRQHAELEKKVVLVGLGGKFEIWDQAIWRTNNEQALAAAQEDGSGLSAELSELSL